MKEGIALASCQRRFRSSRPRAGRSGWLLRQTICEHLVGGTLLRPISGRRPYGVAASSMRASSAASLELGRCSRRHFDLAGGRADAVKLNWTAARATAPSLRPRPGQLWQSLTGIARFGSSRTDQPRRMGCARRGLSAPRASTEEGSRSYSSRMVSEAACAHRLSQGTSIRYGRPRTPWGSGRILP